MRIFIGCQGVCIENNMVFFTQYSVLRIGEPNS